jgi:transcriptional regulator with XRE-family HTH domain
MAAWTIALSKRVLPSAYVDDNSPQTLSPLNVALGRQLAAERTAAGLSLRRLSALSGVSVESITRYEHAKRDIPMPALGKLAAVFNLRPSQIVAAAEERLEREAVNADVTPDVEV